jgi:alpha-1,2-mannosyltransferase
VLLVALCLLVWVAVAGWTIPGVQHWVDLDIYLRSAANFEQTGSLYCLARCDGLGFTYPPLAVLPFIPLSHLHAPITRGVWTFLTIAALLYTLFVVLTRLKIERWSLPVIMAAVLVSDPVRMNVGQGQASVFVGCSALLGMVIAAVPGGALLAVAASVKLTPAVWILPLTMSRTRSERRRILGFCAAGVVLLTASLSIGIQTNIDYLTKVLPETKRVGFQGSISNNSIVGLFAHWHITGIVPLAADFALGATLILALAWCARGSRLSTVECRVYFALAAGLLTYLVTPISWTHHCMFAPMAAGILIVRGRPWIGLVSLLIWVLPVMFIAVEHTSGVSSAAIQTIRPVNLLVLFVLVTQLIVQGAQGHDTARRA